MDVENYTVDQLAVQLVTAALATTVDDCLDPAAADDELDALAGSVVDVEVIAALAAAGAIAVDIAARGTEPADRSMMIRQLRAALELWLANRRARRGGRAGV